MPAKLTESTVKNAAVPATGSTSLWDEEVTGFLLRVHAKGTRSFAFDYRINGRGKRITIGKYPAWTAARARIRAKELRQLVDAGGDPAGEKRERREAPTMRDLAERFRKERLESGNRSRPKDEQVMVDEIVDILGEDTKVASVHYGDMQDLHRKISKGYHDGKKDRKPRKIRANRILACASVMFSMSLKPLAGEDRPWRNAVDGNPCKGIDRNHEEPSGRLYSPTEMAAIADALAEYPGEIARDCVKLITFTGCRPIEAKRALWSEFDKEPGKWVKPSSHTKQKKEHVVPLSAPALQLIEQLRAKRDPNRPIVFPSNRTDDGTFDATQHCWRWVRERAGLPDDARLYDLRHSFASHGASGGLSLPLIGRLLGHSSSKTTERYARHLADDPLQSAVNLIARKIIGKRPRLVSSG